MSITLALPAPVASTLTSPTPHGCQTCYFGATAASLHSFPYTAVETLTLATTPYVITWDDGCIETSTSVNTIFPPGATCTPGMPTLSYESNNTWTSSGVQMINPTTYVQYFGFEKDSLSTQPYATPTWNFCTGQLLTISVELPTPTITASYIYPLQGTLATTVSQNTVYISASVPEPLLDYLQSVATGASQQPLGDIRDCAALPKYFTNGPPLTTTTSTICYTTSTTVTSTVTTATCTCSDGDKDSAPTITPAPEMVTWVECYANNLKVVRANSTTTPGTQALIPVVTVSNTTESTSHVTRTRISLTHALTSSSSSGSSSRRRAITTSIPRASGTLLGTSKT